MSMQDIIAKMVEFLPEQLPSQGSLGDAPAYHVLLTAERSKYSGRIVFERANRVKHVFFDQGNIIGLHSNLVPEGIDVLLGQGFLFSNQIADLFSEIDVPSPTESDWETRLLAILREKKVLQEKNIEQLLLLQLEERVLNLVGWFDGKFLLHKGDFPPSNLRLSKPFSLSSMFDEIMGLFQKHSFSLLLASPHLLERQGELQSTGGARVIFSYAAAHASGTVFFERGQRKKLLHFKSGVLSSVVSTNPTETMGSILTRFRLLSPDLVSRLESTAHAQQTKLQDLLQKEQILGSEQIAFALDALHFERILEAFSWRSGRFEFKGHADHIPEVHTDETTERFTVSGISAKEKFGLALKEVMKKTGKGFLYISSSYSASPRIPNLLLDVVKSWNQEHAKSIFISTQVMGAGPHLHLDAKDPRWGIPDFWKGLEEEYENLLVFVDEMDPAVLPSHDEIPVVILVAQDHSTPFSLKFISNVLKEGSNLNVAGFLWLTKEFLHLE